MSVFEGIRPQALRVHGCCAQAGSDLAASCPCSEGAPHTPGDCAPERTDCKILFLIMQKESTIDACFTLTCNFKMISHNGNGSTYYSIM